MTAVASKACRGQGGGSSGSGVNNLPGMAAAAAIDGRGDVPHALNARGGGNGGGGVNDNNDGNGNHNTVTTREAGTFATKGQQGRRTPPIHHRCRCRQ